ncbi:unnamed protein product [Chrysodeixis includens]|uniref:Uncharacterized protein n=1 Tax=Chrysodeixis includens TaxID=689277 RepID=A0A9N8PWG2_CHRIL|nr:unnamed protein product [Chrysodeixis includens]
MKNEIDTKMTLLTIVTLEIVIAVLYPVLGIYTSIVIRKSNIYVANKQLLQLNDMSFICINMLYTPFIMLGNHCKYKKDIYKYKIYYITTSKYYSMYFSHYSMYELVIKSLWL